MIQRYTHGQLTWIDVMAPTPDEVRELIAECSIPIELTADLTTVTPRTETYTRKQVLKTTLDFPVVKREDVSRPHEIKFLATKKHLITVHFEEIEALHRFQKDFEVSSLLQNAGKSATGGHLLLSVLTELYTAMTFKLDYLESRIIDIEEEIFNEREKEMLYEISQVSRRLVSFRQTLYAHEVALIDLQEAIVTCFGKKFAGSVEVLQDEYIHLLRRVDTLISTMEDLRETNNALLTTKQNEIMKIFTILAFITFPLTLFTSMFGMNTVTTPILGIEGDFWIILGIMGFVSVIFFGYFKYKRWI